MRTIKGAIADNNFAIFRVQDFRSCRELLWTTYTGTNLPFGSDIASHPARTYTYACRTYIRTQKWSELHRLARLRIHPRSRWGVPGVRDQLGRTASSISQKGLPTVSRWRHRRRWSDSSITNQNSWDQVATRRNTSRDAMGLFILAIVWRAVIAEKCCPVFKNRFTHRPFVAGGLNSAALPQKRKVCIVFPILFARIEGDSTYATCNVNPQNLRELAHRSPENANIRATHFMIVTVRFY